jgi:hypothetical protein
MGQDVDWIYLAQDTLMNLRIVGNALCGVTVSQEWQDAYCLWCICSVRPHQISGGSKNTVLSVLIKSSRISIAFLKIPE